LKPTGPEMTQVDPAGYITAVEAHLILSSRLDEALCQNSNSATEHIKDLKLDL
jgi:hypothetical protein